MRQISCPVCHTSPTRAPQSRSVHSCESCGLRWTFLPEEVDTEALYEDEVYAVVDNRRSIFERIIFSEAKKILLQALKLHPKIKSILDFGSGKGQFLAVAKEVGFEGLGIETAKDRADFAREKYQVRVLGEFYSGGKIEQGNFDLITLNHVLEHLPGPIGMMQELLSQNLASKGLVYIEVPRADSWQAKIAGADWMHWDIPKHLTHWTEAGLELEFSKIGFQKVGTRGFSVHLGVLGMLQSLLSKVGFNENLILRLKRKKTLGLLVSIALILPIAWGLEVFSTGFGKSGVVGIYLRRNG
ncbi:class I SAM-dependent methyltransferase [Algoriphagus lacus]|uniref:Class I SAM-dependent methyltransferase n=1 Tax=Algoriphagus lacus TaxID=2056311 RepID=A0A418PW46_9BACT|nr:class I SAM-dependent methyltransferase [Algoriphagus lacus]RIW18313.1 class I SAM-dependent methyltransferase [Algoriphagus lacus]